MARRHNSETFTDGLGQVLRNVHNREHCVTPYCPIHNPSDHEHRDKPRVWVDGLGMFRLDTETRALIPDPDAPEHQRWVRKMFGDPEFDRVISEGIEKAQESLDEIEAFRRFGRTMRMLRGRGEGV